MTRGSRRSCNMRSRRRATRCRPHNARSDRAGEAFFAWADRAGRWIARYSRLRRLPDTPHILGRAGDFLTSRSDEIDRVVGLAAGSLSTPSRWSFHPRCLLREERNSDKRMESPPFTNDRSLFLLIQSLIGTTAREARHSRRKTPATRSPKCVL